MDATKKITILSLVSVFVCGSAFAAQQRVIWQTTASRAIAISPDAQLMLTGLQLRHTSDGSVIRTFASGYSGSSVVNADAFSPDGTLVAIAIQAYNRNLFLFRVADGARLAGPISAHLNGTTCVAFSQDGQFLASGGRDGTVKLWHLPDMTLVRELNGGVGYRPRVFAVLFSKDGFAVILGGQGGVLGYRVRDGWMLRQLTPVSTISLALSPDGKVLLSGSNAIDQYGQCTDCTIKGWSMVDGSFLGSIPGNNNGVTSLAYSPDGNQIAAGAGDRQFSGSVRFFDAHNGQWLGTWFQDPSNSGSYVTSVAYAPFGNMFAYARADNMVMTTFDPY